MTSFFMNIKVIVPNKRWFNNNRRTRNANKNDSISNRQILRVSILTSLKKYISCLYTFKSYMMLDEVFIFIVFSGMHIQFPFFSRRQFIFKTILLFLLPWNKWCSSLKLQYTEKRPVANSQYISRTWAKGGQYNV